MKYEWDPSQIQVTDGEGYIGIYKWADIQQVLGLLYYEDIRELIRKSYLMIKEEKEKSLNSAGLSQKIRIISALLFACLCLFKI